MQQARHRRYFKVWIKTLLLLAMANVGLVQADTATAIHWLSTQQQPDGHYTNNADVATPLQATAEVLRAFYFLGETGQVGIPQAEAFINAEQNHNTENLARIVISRKQAGHDISALMTALKLRQNPNGGFGFYAGYSSTVIDTAFSLEVLAVANQAANNANGLAVQYLLQEQRGDGAWHDGNNESSVYLTALSLRALWHYRQVFGGVSQALIRAQNYLLSQRNATGLWDEMHESALALIAIVPNVNEFSKVEAILTELRSRQLVNGSWSNSPYVTALALRALASQPTALPQIPTKGSMAGRILDQGTNQAIDNAQVSIDNLSLSVSTNTSGYFELKDLSAGNYALRLTAPGYATQTMMNIAVSAGVVSDLGNLKLTPQSTVGILSGQITDAISKQALSGVTVAVSGSVTANTVTNTEGHYSLVNLTPGMITITVTQSGYLPLTAAATVVAGQTIVFSPSLTKAVSTNEPLPGTSTTGELRGRVTDTQTGLPITLAKISVSGANTRAVYSGSDGIYQINNLNPGDVIITVSKSHYLDAVATASVAAGNRLLFSPGLVPQGGDPNNGTGGVSTEPLPGTATTGIVQGVVTHAETGLAIEAANVMVTGSTNASVQTAADGRYAVANVTPGEISISVSKTDFLTVTAQGAVTAGNAVVFNPVLIPEGSVDNSEGRLSGQVVDASTGNPLGVVLVSLNDGSDTITRYTKTNGSYEIIVPQPGGYILQFEKNGYNTRTLPIVISGGGNIKMQAIALSRAITEVTIFGALTDRVSGVPIKGAVISVSGSVSNTQTDAQGRYRLNGLSVGSKTLSFTATGYSSQTLIYDFPQGGEYEINRDLQPGNNTAGIDITAMIVDQTSYNAYADALIQTSVLNNNITSVQANIEFTLYNEQGEMVRTLTAHYVDANGDEQTVFDFAPGIVTQVPLSWNVNNLLPGVYRTVGRVIVGNLVVGPARVILAERAVEFSIKPTYAIAKLTVNPLPAYSAVGVSEPVEFEVALQNRSNDNFEFRFKVRLLSPTQQVVLSENFDLDLGVDEAQVLELFGPFDVNFTEAGEHQLSITLNNSAVTPNLIETGSISVAPGLRIDATQTVSPSAVTPDGDKRIRIKIRLDGKELH